MNKVIALLDHPKAYFGLLCLAVLMHLGFGLLDNFYADDFIHYHVFQPDEQISEKQLIDHSSFSEQFQFFSQRHPEQYQALLNYGVIPWWTQQGASLQFYRPFSSLTHALDYQLWPDSPQLMHLLSFLILIIAYALSGKAFHHLCGNRKLANLALLILLLDVSTIFALIWVSARSSLILMVLMPCMLLALHRSSGEGKANQLLSMLCALIVYILALLTAEAGVGLMAFAVAYVVFQWDRKTAYPLYALGLMIAITVLWKVAYGVSGYGASDIAHYRDPVTDFLAFLSQAVKLYPVLLMHNLVGLDATDQLMRGQLSILNMAGAWFIIAALFWVLKQLKLMDKQTLFWLSAGMLCLLPAAAMQVSDPRISCLPHMAFSVVIARIILAAADLIKARNLGVQKHIAVFSSYWFIVLAHIGFSAVILLSSSFLAMSGKAFNTDLSNQKVYRFQRFDVDDKPLIIVNSIDPFRTMYHAYRNRYFDEPVAQSITQLMLAETDVTVERIDAFTLELEQFAGMRLTAGDVEKLSGNRRLPGVEGSAYLLNGFFHDGDYHFNKDQRIELEHVDITILRVDTVGRPLKVKFTFKQPLADMRAIYWSWESLRYETFELPDVGQRITIAGKPIKTLGVHQ